MNFINQKLYALFFWRSSIGEFLNKWNDLKLHLRYHFKLANNIEKEKLAAYIQKNFHVIEKGLALPQPRPGFGKEKVKDIINNTQKYIKQFGVNDLTDAVFATLKEYYDFCEKNNCKMDDPFYKEVLGFLNTQDKIKNGIGGTILVSKEQINKACNIDFKNFVRNRYSIRDFSEEEIISSEVEEAIEIAKYAPSVCNRQGWKAHYYTDKNKIIELLALQNGNRGFTESINKLIIITGDITSFTKYESNQLFVDGGLFAMNLILSLHAKGIGSVALNTDIPYVIENRMKKTGEIPENERLIMYLGIGKLKDEFRVAKSQRKNLGDILKIHTS